jgi:hypothetical protein
MDELGKEIRDLREKTDRTRYQFLKAELRTCSTAMEIAQYQLSIGSVDVARTEADCVEAGLSTIRRFLLETSPEQQAEIEAKVAELTALLHQLRIKLSAEA